MSQFNVILTSNESTVVAEYEPQGSRSDAYQSEAALEDAFIKLLSPTCGHPITENLSLLSSV